MGRIPKALKIVLFALGGLAAALLLAALALRLFVDVDAFKPRVEAAASRALGMDVTVEGRLHVGFVRGLHVALEKVRVRNRGAQIAFVEEADLAIDLVPLFRRELRYDSITLKRARISVERGRDGRYSFEKPSQARNGFKALSLKRVTFIELVVAYADQLSGNGFESRDCKGELADMRHPGDAPFLMRLSVSGQFACREVRGKDMAVSDLEFTLAAKEGDFRFTPVTMLAFGGQGSGSLRMDRSAEVPVLHVGYSLAKFRVEDFFKTLPPGKSMKGLMDLSTTLSMRGRTRDELRRSAAGEMSLSGTNLTLEGVDIDRQLSKYESSQNFNLFDMTAVLLAGPIGLVVTKGYELSSLAQDAGGATQIRTLVSKWKVEKGVAHAQDVALTTPVNLLALHGGLDFVDHEYDEVFVALVDSNGCAKVRQRIRGPFAKPVVEKPGALASLTGPVANLLKRATDLIPGTGVKCEVFYDGSVARPK